MKNDNQKKLLHGGRVALGASVATLFLAIVKYGAGRYYSSDVLIADSMHSFADTAAIVASAFGLYLARRPKNNRFPYGLYKAETLALLFVGLFIAYAGVDLFHEGYRTITSRARPADLQWVPVIVALSSMIVAVIIAFIELKTSRDINSRSLEANAKESFLDIATSFIVLGGIVLPSYHVPYVEGVVIIIISLLVFKIGVENIFHSVLVLLDADTNKKLRGEIEYCVVGVRGVKGVNQVKIRETGPFKIVELDILASPSATVYAVDRLSDTIRNIIYREFDNIEGIFIDVKPAKNEVYRAVIPVKDVNGLESRVYDHFGKSKYFIIITIHEGVFEIEDFYLNEFLGKDKRIGLNVIKSIIHYNIDILLTVEIGEISFHILRDNLIDIYKVPEGDITVKDVAQKFLAGKLEKIESPTHSSDSVTGKN
ncbi:MAG TPA: cation diffusion facilitator family transporter [Spirochaetota bacterium]|nr:cation diffusion facilitator family transporter [Spirochaetota bacterium]